MTRGTGGKREENVSRATKRSTKYSPSFIEGPKLPGPPQKVYAISVNDALIHRSYDPLQRVRKTELSLKAKVELWILDGGNE